MNRTPVKSYKRLEGGRRSRLPAHPANRKGPMVSIITVVLNGNKTIQDTIRSVVGQTFDSFEYIIIDGVSTDGTIDTLIKNDNSLDYWVSEPDRGIYDVMNKGIDLALGEWIYFLGSDDTLYDENVLARVFSQPREGKLLYGNVLWGETGKTYDGFFSKDKLLTENICQQAIFYHKDLFCKIGKFDLYYPLLADYLFNMRAFATWHVKPYYIDTIIARYSTSGISSTKGDPVFVSDREFLIQKIFGFRYYYLFKNPDEMVIKKSLHQSWKAFVYYLEYLNSHAEETNKYIPPIRWRFLSKSYHLINTTINTILPVGSYRRKAIKRLRNLILPTLVVFINL